MNTQRMPQRGSSGFSRGGSSRPTRARTGTSFSIAPPSGAGHFRSSGPSRGGSSFSRGGSSSRGSFRGGSAKPFNPKRGFKSDRLDVNLFINKAIVATETEAYVPKHTFADFAIHPELAKNLARKNYIAPSPIQDQAIPVVIEGKDVIGIASTGTGKTAAFLIPLINKLVNDKSHSVMVLAPTRELAQQIEVEFKSFTQGMKLYSVSCVGGSPIGKQIRELDMGVHIIIGTPGRVKDLINRGKINMSAYGSIVLDEADRMLDMGFVDDMRFILGKMPKVRQGLFFSATFSADIKRLCTEFLNNPVSITIPSRDTSANVEQDVVRFRAVSEKIELLHDLLNQPNAKKVLIFRETKRSVDQLAKELQDRGFKALGLHGDMRNRERARAIESLATDRAQIVIATDVAARGIDIADISHVINYDIPSTYDTYVHRIGRTGRSNKQGLAFTFVPHR